MSITPRFYNTLTHQLEDFHPITPGKVSMYNCGPTVYDFAHIGNFKTFIFSDVLRRFLELIGHEVHQVMNLTDVGHMTDDALADGGGEDKMEAAAKRLLESKKSGEAHAASIEDPNDPYQISKFYIDAFLDDARKLGLKVADDAPRGENGIPQNMPRATDHVKQMLQIVGTLLEKGHAYVAPGSGGAVYFRIQSFPAYGKLSGNTLDQLRGGAGGRLDATHQSTKEHPADFLLWKPDPTHLMRWDPRTPGMGLSGPAAELGVGYPGWHIECSAMAKAVLGRDIIDIHTGGEDNIFPHHECEIAQTCCATGQERFARFWMHSRHLMVEGEKMSKSKGNFFTVRQVLDGTFTGRAVDPAVLRFELLKANYRSRMDFSRKGLLDSASAVSRFQNAYGHTLVSLHAEYDAKYGGFEEMNREADSVSMQHQTVREFTEALCDDLNIAAAIGVVFSWIKSKPSMTTESLGVMDRFNDVLAIRNKDKAFSTPDHSSGQLSLADVLSTSMDSEVLAKCAALDDARRNGDFAKADALRDELQAAGYEVKTTKDGTVATKRLA